MITFPVTSSIVSEKELGEFIIKKYNLNKGFDCKLYRTGMNHTYFISDGKLKYVVRVYCHHWRTKHEIKEELGLLKLLKKNNLSISFPIPDQNENYIQEINAPEGIRYVVLFSFANGDKMRFMSHDCCSTIGSLIAKIHKITVNKRLDRINYNPERLLKKSHDYLRPYFSDDLDEIKTLREIGNEITDTFQKANLSERQKGIVHLDIWYDNLSVNTENEITIFDFDNCGNGMLVLDLGYFCKQLFFIEQDKKQYESKVQSFLNGYQKTRKLSDTELNLIPEAGAFVFIFYLGVQAQRFDWSNIFLTENYLKMYTGRIKSWVDYHKTKGITTANTV